MDQSNYNIHICPCCVNRPAQYICDDWTQNYNTSDSPASYICEQCYADGWRSAKLDDTKFAYDWIEGTYYNLNGRRNPPRRCREKNGFRNKAVDLTLVYGV
jgi:hypothetical protein